MPIGALFLIFIIIIVVILSSPSQETVRKHARGQYGVASTTRTGIEVKSRSERRIADYFDRFNVKYVYEPTLDGIYARPDFYLPDYDVYVEFWGLTTAERPRDALNYMENMRRKESLYQQHGLKYVSLYPDDLKSLMLVFPIKLRAETDRELQPELKYWKS